MHEVKHRSYVDGKGLAASDPPEVRRSFGSPEGETLYSSLFAATERARAQGVALSAWLEVRG